MDDTLADTSGLYRKAIPPTPKGVGLLALPFMSDIRANSNVKQVAMNLVVTRCMCRKGPGAHDGLPCPHGVQENMGTVGYWSARPIQRLIYRLRRFANQSHSHWHK